MDARPTRSAYATRYRSVGHPQRLSYQPIPIAGQVQRIRSSVIAAQSTSEDQRQRVAKTLNEQLASGATPVAVKAEAIRALGAVNAPVALDGLEAALRESDDDLRAAACVAIGNYQSGRSVELLAGMLSNEPSNDVRIAAARSLGRLTGPKAVEALGLVLDDSDPAVQLVAMRALQRSTGAKLGMDVRQWKQAISDPEVLVAGRRGSLSR